MPYSDPDNKHWTLTKLSELQPTSVLDVGPGSGAYGHLIRQVGSALRVDAVEVWEPYVDRFSLQSLYDNVYIEDVRNRQDFAYDVVIFGDVLEHMTREDALKVYEQARLQAKAVIFSIPIIHVPQGAAEGNPYEVHVEDNWTHEEILEWFPGIVDYATFRVTGVYFAHAA